MQTKRQSLIEVWCSTVFAFIVSVFVQFLVMPLYGYHPTMLDNIGMVAMFTVISLIRSYYTRRFFNWFFHREVKHD